MGHTGLELCAKTTGNTPLCKEGGANQFLAFNNAWHLLESSV